MSGGELESGCVDEDGALAFVSGRLPEIDVKRIDSHADRCEQCQLVLAEAARSFRSRWTDSPHGPAGPLTRFVPGDRLAGRYRILRFIARGGMGEVYEAYDLMLNTRLALKTLAATISDDPQAIRRLKQEVNLARRITHPNVCRIFDLGVHEQSGERPAPGVLFLTMELVPGISLGERLRADGRMDGDAALPIVRAIVAAMGAAHRAHIIHRDLKSDNVMLAADERGGSRVVVMDFGLARATTVASDSTSADGQTLAGTLAYMAPEQLEGKAVGVATDIYALGVVMYEMLTGDLPFKGQPPLPAAWKRVTEPAPSIGALAPGLDPRWQRIVASCLERDPERRPAAVQDIDRELRFLDSSNTVPAIPPLPNAPPRAPVRRARVAIAGGAVLLGGVGLLLLTHWLGLRPASGAAENHGVRASQAPMSAESRPGTAGPPPARPPPVISPEQDPPTASIELPPTTGTGSAVTASRAPRGPTSAPRPAHRRKPVVAPEAVPAAAPDPDGVGSKSPAASTSAARPPPLSRDPNDGFIFE